MKKYSFIVLLLLFCSTAFSQKALLFTNKETGKEILVKEGDLIKLGYDGYIKQPETVMGVVTVIQDSIIEIVSPMGNRLRMTNTRFLYTKDITGFRKFYRSRPFLMFLSRLTIAAGTLYLYYSIDQKTSLTFAENLGISLGAGIISNALMKGIFPERIKNYIGSEWEVKVLK